MNITGFTSSSSAYPPSPQRPAGASASPAAPQSQPAASNKTQLSQEALAQIAKLKQRDQEVRQHEQAHLAAAGGIAVSGASFTYQKGPDGVNYAVGGEVSIDTSPGRTPEETISRAQTIRAAALAPADPSGQDRAVAAQATQMEQQARGEQAQQPTEDAASNAPEDRQRQHQVAGYYAATQNAATQAATGSLMSTYA